MPRGLTTTQLATVSGRVFRPAMFVHVDIIGNPLRVWDGVGDVVVLGNTWKGVGQLGAIEGISNERGLTSNAITVGLHGLSSAIPGLVDFLAQCRAAQLQGVTLKVYMCMTQTETDVPLTDPWVMWSGVCDVLSYQIGDSVTVSLSGEHYSSFLRRINGLRQSHESHVARLGFSGDIFYRFLTRLAGKAKLLT
jgi:hypothetical protein